MCSMPLIPGISFAMTFGQWQASSGKSVWASFLSTLSFSWPLSLLWAISLALGLLTAGLWLIVAVRIKRRSSKESATVYYPKEYYPPLDPKKLGVLCALMCVLVIGYVRYLMAEPPVFEYTLGRDGCCKILGVSPDQTKWHLLKDDGDFWFDFCIGPNEYDPKLFDAHPGMVITKLRYEDHGCKSVMRADLGAWFKKNDQGKTLREN